MKANELLDIIGDADDNMLADAMETKINKRTRWSKLIAIAACLCLIATGMLFWTKGKKPIQQDSGIVLSDNGVTIPKIEVALSSNSSADMIGFFIYHGNCYVQYEWLEDTGIVGEYLGTITGLIDEWTSQDGYVEFAGSVKGDFFAVKGYDPEFMLCMKHETGDVETYICNNGITLKYGSELFEDRLHLSGNYDAVQYESRDSWYYSKSGCYLLNGNNEIINRFIEEMNRAEFIPWEDAAKREGHTTGSMIDDMEIYHVYFKMMNGTTIHLRLYENGYVRFQGLLDVCVQVPEESFNVLVDLMRNNTDSELIAFTNQTEKRFEVCKNNPELGMYIPTYEVPESELLIANVFYYIESKSSVENGTKLINIEYTSATNSNLYYSITITWKSEYGNNGWVGPMIDNAELSVEALSEYEHTKESTGNTWIDVGVWYGDISVVLSANGFGAEEAFKIFQSIK